MAPADAAAARAERWARYLADLQDYAALEQPLPSSGTLVRVTGLVLEAAGVRVPVGSVCEVRSDGQPAVLAEVVGFHGDRAFLMPTGELQGLTSGALVQPLPPPHAPPAFGAPRHPWRRSEDRGLHLPVGDGLHGSAKFELRGPASGVKTAAELKTAMGL